MASGHTCTTAATMKEEHYLECCLALGSRKMKVTNAQFKVHCMFFFIILNSKYKVRCSQTLIVRSPSVR